MTFREIVETLVEALNKSVSSLSALLLIGAAVAGWLFFNKLSDDAMLGIAGAAVGYLYGTSRRGMTAPAVPPPPASGASDTRGAGATG